MGLGIWPVFKPRTGIHPQLDGKLLLDESESLDRLSSTLGVKTMTSFADNREVPAGFDGDEDALESLLGPWEEWFEPGNALPTFAALIGALQRPEVAAKFDDVDGLLYELRDAERCLLLASQTGARFRLEVL